MTLKTLLKKHGVKVRGLVPAIEKWAFDYTRPTLDWYESSVKEKSEKLDKAEKVIIELQANGNNAAKRSETYEIEVKKLRQKETELMDRVTDLQNVEQENATLKTECWILRDRISKLDKAIAKWKNQYWFSDDTHP